MRRLLLPALVVLAAIAFGAPAAADGGAIDVVLLEGVLDPTTADFVAAAIDDAVAAGSQAVILQVDATGATDDAEDLVDLVASPPLPVVVWVGDAPAQALGVAARLAEVATVVTAAPGAEVGWSEYSVVGGDADDEHVGPFTGEPLPAEPGDPRFATVQAAVGQVVVWLDGQEVTFAGGTTVLETAEETTDDDGQPRLEAVEVRFIEAGIGTRLLDAPLHPGTLIFLLAAGLSVAAFEFYALGPGVAAATALLPLLVAAYGVAHLPLAWWAVVLLLGGLLLMVIDYQAGAFGLWSIVGTGLVAVGGRYFVAGAPLVEATWVGAGLTALATALFFAVAMPVVARSRFSTGTFGRSHLVGKPGTVVVPFRDGAGEVEVDGARWKATAHRESHLPEGSEVEVTAVQGLWLEVEPEVLS